MADKKRALKKVADDEFDVEMSEAFSGGNPKNYKAVISQGLKFDLDAKGKITKLPYLKKKKTPTIEEQKKKLKKTPTKKMNMGGVMKSRGGTYKGTY
tara:strand:+ start:50 stop:340 length:291 start_codon:yes stop_codon:yes gene_type:complete